MQDELTITEEGVPFDDKSLVRAYYRLKREYLLKKREFRKINRNPDANDYLPLAVARLKYEIAKEEYHSVLHEINNRGIDEF